MSNCACPDDWVHGCFWRKCPRSAAIIEASRQRLLRAYEALGDQAEGVTVPAAPQAQGVNMEYGQREFKSAKLRSIKPRADQQNGGEQ